MFTKDELKEVYNNLQEAKNKVVAEADCSMVGSEEEEDLKDLSLSISEAMFRCNKLAVRYYNENIW